MRFEISETFKRPKVLEETLVQAQNLREDKDGKIVSFMSGDYEIANYYFY